MSWSHKWKTNKDWLKIKHNNFTLLDSYLQPSPRTILDIGCGFAVESCLFAKKYNTHLTLIDGEVDDNASKQNRHDDFGVVEEFKFYNKLSDIEDTIKEHTSNYTLIDCNHIDINPSTKFDLICSWKSCGFHYPLDAYKKICMQHSHENTRLIFDIRKKQTMPSNIKIVNIIEDGQKHIKAEIKFL